MTLVDSILLFLMMAALAALPSSSVLLVVTQSATRGVMNGLATSVGIVCGDLIFMTLAILGMTVLATEMGALFTVIKFLAAAYLLWLGFGLIRSQFSKTEPILDDIRSSAGAGNMISSFLAGLLLTLGDVKAIFFYASLLPTFLDLSALTVMDIVAVSAITIVAVGGVKAIYAISTDKLANLGSGFGYERPLKIASGSMLMLVGGYLALKH